MQKEDIMVLAQLLTGLKDAVANLEKAEKKKDMEEIAAAKREIISLQAQIDKII
jgi:hypothetical protein